jgi:23S rRNA (adenine2030-N6)-methyltransferase
MNYRHAFHAGNFADVLKHAVLLALLESLKAKATPFCYVDTHAGSGRYDLKSSEARRTNEADDGILKLSVAAGLPPLLWDLLGHIRALNEGADDLRYYPGSPLLAQRVLRDIDSAQLCELQGDEAEKLRQLLHGDKRMHVHQRDGYEALKALTPPAEKRGLVLIDPPFEAREQEFRTIEHAMKQAMQRWPTGMYAVWYPIKQRSHIQPFHRWAARSGSRRVLVAEILLHPDNSPLRLNGSGLIVFNAPWKFDEVIRDTLQMLTRTLGPPSAEYRLTWLANDNDA